MNQLTRAEYWLNHGSARKIIQLKWIKLKIDNVCAIIGQTVRALLGALPYRFLLCTEARQNNNLSSVRQIILPQTHRLPISSAYCYLRFFHSIVSGLPSGSRAGNESTLPVWQHPDLPLETNPCTATKNEKRIQLNIEIFVLTKLNECGLLPRHIRHVEKYQVSRAFQPSAQALFNYN